MKAEDDALSSLLDHVYLLRESTVLARLSHSGGLWRIRPPQSLLEPLWKNKKNKVRLVSFAAKMVTDRTKVEVNVNRKGTVSAPWSLRGSSWLKSH